VHQSSQGRRVVSDFVTDHYFFPPWGHSPRQARNSLTASGLIDEKG